MSDEVVQQHILPSSPHLTAALLCTAPGAANFHLPKSLAKRQRKRQQHLHCDLLAGEKKKGKVAGKKGGQASAVCIRKKVNRQAGRGETARLGPIGPGLARRAVRESRNGDLWMGARGIRRGDRRGGCAGTLDRWIFGKKSSAEITTTTATMKKRKMTARRGGQGSERTAHK